MASSPSGGLQLDLKPYTADLPFTTLTPGIDNIRYDAFLSPRLTEVARKYLVDLIRQTTKAADFYGMDARSFRAPETTAFRKVLTDTLQVSLTQAQFQKSIEPDILFRLALLKFLLNELSAQFANLILECKARLRARGAQFEQSEQGYVLRARLTELQADRRNVFREVGQQLYRILGEVEASALVKLRRALFGEEFAETYQVLNNRLLFVEGGRDARLYLEHYVLVGNFVRDEDRLEAVDALFLDFLREYVSVSGAGEEGSAAAREYEELSGKVLYLRDQLTGLEQRREDLLRRMEGEGDLFSRLRAKADPAELRAELADVEQRRSFLTHQLAALGPQLEEAKRKAEYFQEQSRSNLGDYLNEPENARRLFDAGPAEQAGEVGAERARLLEGWVSHLEQGGLLLPVLASYEVRNLHLDYCPPLHLQQLKRSLVHREERKQLEQIFQQFPARKLSLKRIEDAGKALTRCPRETARAVARRFAEDFMRLRRDLRNYQRVVALMERINLIRDEPTRELSRMNNSLYEFLLPEEARPVEDRVVSHAVIKADVRGSSKITHDLMARGLNPASHFSLNLHNPVKRLLERYGAAKVFLEGDAIILAIYETESNRAHQRAVAKACVLAREILTVSQAYNARVESSDLPRLELGVGVAFQNSPPTYWVDSDSRLMISRALNLSDRLSSCSKVARRLLAQNTSPFRLFLFGTAMAGASEEEAEELTIRYNMNGIELNEEGFVKLSEEVSLQSAELSFPMPWGEQSVQLYIGEVPIGEKLEQLVIRKGLVRQVLPDGKFGEPGTQPYYEVCVDPKVFQAVQEQVLTSSRKS